MICYFLNIFNIPLFFNSDFTWIMDEEEQTLPLIMNLFSEVSIIYFFYFLHFILI